MSTLPEFSSSLISSSSYIAQVNISSDSLRGRWTVMLQSAGSYTIQVFGISELSFSSDLYRVDSSSTYGFTKINGRPSQGWFNSLYLYKSSHDSAGQSIVAMLTTEGGGMGVTINTLNLISEDGVILESIDNLIRLDDDTSAGVFEPPAEVFTLQLLGTDANGFPFSYISDASVEVASIDLELSASVIILHACTELECVHR